MDFPVSQRRHALGARRGCKGCPIISLRGPTLIESEYSNQSSRRLVRADRQSPGGLQSAAWNARIATLGGEKWQAQLFMGKGGGDTTQGYADRWPGRHEASFSSLQQGCSEIKNIVGRRRFSSRSGWFREGFVADRDNYSSLCHRLMLGIAGAKIGRRKPYNIHLLQVHQGGAGDDAHLLRRCAQLGAVALLSMPGSI